MPEIVEVDSTQLEEVLRRVEQSLDEKDAALIRAVFESYVYVTDLVEDKNTSIRRLRQLFFGARTEKTDAVVGRGSASARNPRSVASRPTMCARALKKAILHRKNSLFYKTQNGARVGDLFMSLIYTCQLNQANPFDYLTQLQRHSDEVGASPQRWMPWNYRAGLSVNESDHAVGVEPPTK